MTRSRAFGLVALLLLGSLACVLLGLWQYSRHIDRAAQVELITTNLEAPVVPASQLLGTDLHGALSPADVWRPVQVRGTWVPDSGVQLRNRPVAGANASHALGLLRTQEGALLVIDRGWWRQGDTVPDGALDLPAGPVELTVRLRAAEPTDARHNPVGQVYTVTPGAIIDTASGALTDPEALRADLVAGAYGIQHAPGVAEPLALLPNPDISLRSHLSYALQWWFFALAIPVAGVVLVRRDRANADAAAAQVPTRRRRPTQAEEEDALLDAWEASGPGQPQAPQADQADPAHQARDTSSA